MGDIEVVAADTETTPVDIGSWISGLTLVTGNAVKLAAEEAKRLLLDAGAKELGIDPARLGLKGRRIYVLDDPGMSIPFAKAIARHIRENSGDPIIGKGSFRGLKDAAVGPSLKNGKGTWSDSYAFDAQVAEVEVDMATGRVKVVKSVTAHDCGFPINPLLVEGQIDGQISMAAGQAVAEEVLVKKGVTLNPSFLDYKLPIATEVVENEYIDVITEKFESGREFRTKEVGEGYVSAVLAAIANAVHNATGAPVTSLPIRIRGDEEAE